MATRNASEAIKLGAAAAGIRRQVAASPAVLVKDTRFKRLGELAHYCVKSLIYLVVAITGTQRKNNG